MTAPERTVYRYSGRRRDGTPVFGATYESPDKLAARLYIAGWRELRITVGQEEVGGISRYHNGTRHWWGETRPAEAIGLETNDGLMAACDYCGDTIRRPENGLWTHANGLITCQEAVTVR